MVIRNVGQYVDEWIGEEELKYTDERWFISNACKEYLQDKFSKNPALRLQDILDGYAENMKFLNDNDFFGGTDAEISIRKNDVEITIWGLNESNKRCIMQRNSLFPNIYLMLKKNYKVMRTFP